MGSAGKGGKGVEWPEVETAVTGTDVDASILLDPLLKRQGVARLNLPTRKGKTTFTQENEIGGERRKFDFNNGHYF